MDRLENVATPLTADMVVVPDSVPPPGLVPMATVMLAVEAVTVFPNTSCTATCNAGLIVAPALALVGCWTNATLEGTSGLMGNAADVAPVSDAAVAVSV